MKMQAGKYYVGDLCYVMHSEWDEVCALLFADRTDHGCNEGEFTLKDGRRFAIYNTAYGDGVYADQFGNSYPVDAGSIGCIRVEDVNDPQAWLAGMNVITFDQPFYTDTDGSVISIGNIDIDTDPEYHDEAEYDEEEF
jgi:hypothetical protein